MSLELYTATAAHISRLATKRYTSSFYLGINLLDPRLRLPICQLYGFVRYADEIVDTFPSRERDVLLKEFARETCYALERRLSTNPIIHAFQDVYYRYNMDVAHIYAFLASMEMDVVQTRFDDAAYRNYIHGSAEVVGLMCLHIFCEGDKERYLGLEPGAKALGAALQKVNFLRDLRADYFERGRIYFPGVTFESFGEADKLRVVEDIQKDFDLAKEALSRLPAGARVGVYAVWLLYAALLSKLRHAPAEAIKAGRVRVTPAEKALLLPRAYADVMLGRL